MGPPNGVSTYKHICLVSPNDGLWALIRYQASTTTELIVMVKSDIDRPLRLRGLLSHGAYLQSDSASAQRYLLSV